MKEETLYTECYKKWEFDAIYSSAYFFLLGSEIYCREILIPGTYGNRQIKIAAALKKPALIAFQDTVPEQTRVSLRMMIPNIRDEISWHKGDASFGANIQAMLEKIRIEDGLGDSLGEVKD